MKVFTIVFLNVLLVMASGTPVEEFISGNNQFTAALYKEISKSNKGNIFASPLSAEIILALVHSGAKGETAQEIRTALRLPETKEKTESAIKDLLSTLKGNENYSLHTANKVYVKEGLHIKEQFKTVATDTFQSEIENVNFAQNRQTADAINEWVEKHTNNKIRNIISPQDLDPLTAAILVNALYFKADWISSFDKVDTFKHNFYKTSQDIVKVDMMYKSGIAKKYFEDIELDAAFLEMPFKGEEVSMVFVLPNQKDGISLLESHIDKVFVEREFKTEFINVGLPLFKVENNIDLNEILSTLGMKKAFDNSQADFSEIAGKKGDLFVGKVKQKAFIEVNENGVEAAAATESSILLISAPITAPKSFIADHPFIFYIKYKNVILFAGRVSLPQQD